MRSQAAQAAGCRVPYFPILLACLAGFLAACLDGGGNGDEGWAALSEEAQVPNSTGSYAPTLIALPDSSVLAVWAQHLEADSGREKIAMAKIGPDGESDGEILYAAPDGILVDGTFADAYPEGNGFVAGWIEKGRREGIKVLAAERSLGRSGPINVTPPGALFIRHASVLALPDFGFAVACAYIDSASYHPVFWTGRFDFTGRPADAAPFLAESSRTQEIFTTALLRKPGGGWMALWKEFRLNDPSQIAAQVFGQDGTTSGPLRRWNAPRWFQAVRASLKAFPYPGDRVLIQSEGYPPACGALVSWSGDRLQEFRADTGFLEDARFATLDSAKGRYLAHSAGQFRLVDSTMSTTDARKVPADSATNAFCVTASGRPALLANGPGGTYRILLYDPLWR